jgi:hypothetical protein
MFGYEKPTALERYEATQEHLSNLYDDMVESIDALDTLVDNLQDRVDSLSDELYHQKNRTNTAYTQRTIAAVAFAHTVLSLGGSAGVGLDSREDQPAEWRVVLYIDTTAGQMSWHISPEDQHMLEGLPKYNATWDGVYNSADLNFYKRFTNATE